MGLFLLYAYFTGHKPEWLNMKVFAIASFYGEHRYFSVIQTNIIDEAGAVLSIGGLLLLFFSKTYDEDPGIHVPMRIKALVHSIWIIAIVWFIIILFVYGYAIFFVSTAMFGLYLLSCNIHFNIQRLKNKKQRRSR